MVGVRAFQSHPLQVVAVATDKAPTCRVKTQSKLGRAGLSGQLEAYWIEGKIGAVQRHSSHLATIAGGGAPDAVVRSERQAVN